jgi:hypothetical protein
MLCIRYDVHRLLPLYMDGAASARATQRIERHLLDCGRCRARLVRLRDAKTLIRELPSVEARSFDHLREPAPASSPRRVWRPSRLLRHFAADALVAGGLFAAFTLVYTHAVAARSSPIDLSSFEPVDLRNVASIHDPHVIVQGVVSRIDGDFENEARRRFRLSDANDPKAFVVCEILDGDAPSMPKTGTHVRVWGVTRYDSKPAHNWYEIHPVLKLEVVR